MFLCLYIECQNNPIVTPPQKNPQNTKKALLRYTTSATIPPLLKHLLRQSALIISCTLVNIRPIHSLKMTAANTNVLQVKFLSEHAKMPTRGSPQSAGFDLSSAEKTVVPAGGRAVVKTDLSVACPEGTYARIAPRR